MMQITDTMRVYLNKCRQGVITCLGCGQKRTINMSNYKEHFIGGKALKVKCSACSKIFHVKFDFRRYPRLNVKFPGKLVCMDTKEVIETVTVASISVGGIGFILPGNAELNKEYIYEIRFNLDDVHRSLICEEILVKRIEGLLIGAEFYHNEKYNYELDFYIMSEPWSM